jgi:cyclic pyranopterin phosphate synthase
MSIDYLRVSVTDKCNLRCIYCHPTGDFNLMEQRYILKLEEIRHIVELFTRCGIKKVRLTGGEPLLRGDIFDIVNSLSSVPGVEDLSITTNGVLLESLATGLKAAGLNRINISVDTMERSTYGRMTGLDMLPKVTKGIKKVIEIGLAPVKINSVVVKGFNDSKKEITALARMSVRLPVAVRFVEYCPTNNNVRSADDYVPNSEVRKIIEDEFGSLESVSIEKGYGPAVYFKINNSAGAIGFISGRSSMFCRACNRLRLTSDGKVKPCLYSAHQYDLKGLLRDNAGDEQILRLLRGIIREKGSYTKMNSFEEEFSMQRVGG